jgi:hypothetical protein
MKFDRMNTFGTDQTLAATGQLGDVLDLGASGVLANGNGDVKVFAYITTAATGTAGGTCTIALQSDDDSAFGSPTTLLTFPAKTVAQLATAGAVLVEGTVPRCTERYLRLYKTNSITFSAGKATAGLALELQSSL